MAVEEEATISIPSLMIVGVIIFFSYRYFFAARSSNSTPASSQTLRFSAAQVEQVLQMFPQLSRRDIMWDLHRNRGSVQATTERVLAGRGLDPVSKTSSEQDEGNRKLTLDQAPPSFQPPITFAATSSAPLTSAAQPKVTEPDLITRYNLQSRVSTKGKEKEQDPTPPGWSISKDDRQKTLQRRRDEMILAARRKMQEKDELAS